MKIVYEVIRKLNYLKPQESYNEKILEFFLKSGLQKYFSEEDQYEITFNMKNNYLEITNISSHEEYIIEKKDTSLIFTRLDNNEILFYIINNRDKISLVDNTAIKIIKINEDGNEQYSLINNDDGSIITLSDLKVKISNKYYFECKNFNGKSKSIGIPIDENNKYEQIFNLIASKHNNEKSRVRKRLLLNLF